jgi:hypothetical protein
MRPCMIIEHGVAKVRTRNSTIIRQWKNWLG